MRKSIEELSPDKSHLIAVTTWGAIHPIVRGDCKTSDVEYDSSGTIYFRVREGVYYSIKLADDDTYTICTICRTERVNVCKGIEQSDLNSCIQGQGR